MGRELGVTEQQLLDMGAYGTSPAFDERERAALDLAAAMARTPTEVPAQLTARLLEYFDETQLVELAAAIAWEGYQARFNRVFGVRPSGFSQGVFCPLPEKHEAA